MTPRNFLDFVSLFVKLYDEKQAENATVMERLEVGIGRLQGTNQVVDHMRQELTELQPILQEKKKVGLSKPSCGNARTFPDGCCHS